MAQVEKVYKTVGDGCTMPQPMAALRAGEDRGREGAEDWKTKAEEHSEDRAES